jgi:aryl-alcohol dehydrogenase-like predicted oxidoreductase
VKSKFILGTVQFGLDYGINNTIGKPTENQVHEMLDFAALNGIGILDTADAYGNATELLGKYNRMKKNRFKINTKFKCNDESLEAQLSGTLEKLNTKSVNTYFYHSFLDFEKHSEILPALVKLKRKNRIEKIGMSVYDNNEFKVAINLSEIDVIQFPFNLLDNRSQRGENMKLAKVNKKELQVRSVFLQGLFFKSYDDLPPKLTALKPYLKNISDLLMKNHLSVQQLALSYAMQQPEIDHIIIGVDSLEQLRHNLNMGKQKISPEILESIDQIKVLETELLYPKNW